MGTDSSSQQNKQRGFSLVEAAIVLAVVGLVLGGIWVAASAINDKLKVNRLTEIILNIDSETRKLFPPQLWPSESSGYTNIVQLLLDRRIIPEDLRIPSRYNVFQNIISKEGSISVDLLYPPLTTRRINYHIDNITSDKMANLFLSSFIPALEKTKKLAGCFCILSDGSTNIDRWDYPSDPWPPACPATSAGTYLAIGCSTLE